MRRGIVRPIRKCEGLTDPLEIEAKFLSDGELLARLTSAGEVAGCPVMERSWLRLETVYYDTPDRQLARQDCTLRLRRGEPAGVLLTFKRGRVTGEISRREELEAIVPADYDPAQPTIRPQPLLIAEWMAVGRTLAPALTVKMDRTLLIVDSDGARLNLCLDRASRPDKPGWRDYEIEVELHSGPEAGLTTFVQRLQREYNLKQSASSKAERAMRAATDD